MKTIQISNDRSIVTFDGVQYAGSCVVRTAENGLRLLHRADQVYLSTNADGSNGKPIQPGVYPSGTWNVIYVKDMDPPDTDLGPIVIGTDAHQDRPVWALDDQGGYDHETTETVTDWGYEIHFCDPIQFGIYSVGCEHIRMKSGIVRLANAVRISISQGEKVQVVAD